MVIALLAVLGVDVIVLVAFAAFVFSRKRWVKRQPGAFHGVIRVPTGGRRSSREMGPWLRALGPRRPRMDEGAVRDPYARLTMGAPVKITHLG
jgi:hypothetical protein